MGYILVNLKDTTVTLEMNNWGWRTLRILLTAAGWQPMGATGHWDIMTDTRMDIPLSTSSERFDSYEGCCLQQVRDEDAQSMVASARMGISWCEADPDETFEILQVLLPDETKAKKKTPESVAEANKTVQLLLRNFAEFAEHGAFFID